MPPKRTRRISPTPNSSTVGERLKRAKLIGVDYSAWGWVGTDVTNASEISLEHRLATCGFARTSLQTFCANKFSQRRKISPPISKQPASGELEDDVIVISDDEPPSCNPKQCRGNPNCLNHLGQDKWENEGRARDAFLKQIEIGDNPRDDARENTIPVGLKNLGATCYANAFLQVWYQDIPFRSGVYQCLPPHDEEQRFEESPIFQLQVTFTAMQECTQSSFNPVKLVESLKLRTTEQQDAQEFSKLFMAHLDSEFEKQSAQGLRSLLADQFQGKLAYSTTCSNCQTKSERESEFLEIEVNLQNNATLEDRIAALLEPEILSGENQYLCSVCESLQDARRCTEYRQLPPVLHVSLLRFIFDLTTMERKKSKHAVAFPMTLDMGRFLPQPDCMIPASEIYQLRGVLLHKGSSAYHGHYEAQVFDVKNQAWYQFNDETVTKIESLGPKLKATNGDKGEHAGANKSLNGPTRPKKRARIQDSDVEIVSDPSTPKSDENITLNRDAYMLIYARVPKELSPDDSQMAVDPPVECNGSASSPKNIHSSPIPPARAREVVQTFNEEYDKTCLEYLRREHEAREQFVKKRRLVMDIYRSWEVTSANDDSVVVSKHALESWLGRYIQKPSDRSKESPTESLNSSPKESSVNPIASGSDLNRRQGRVQTFSNSDITCIHGRLDPNKSIYMKRISKRAVERILSEDNAEFEPSFEPRDVCELCVERNFKERIYQIDHPQLVNRFEDVLSVDEDERGYWISKPWLRDWKLAKPKMHAPCQPDPPPDSEEFRAHVECEHGGLTTNISSRRRISIEAYNILREIFPDWHTLSTDMEPCAVCEAAMHIAREDKRGIRRHAEDEKAKLKHTFDHALVGTTQFLEHVPCAIVPSQFLRMWKQWLFRPTELIRPERVDTSQFVCEHELLSLDPNDPGDRDATVSFIKRSDWEVLKTLYPCGPLIAVVNEGGNEGHWVHELPLCTGCRASRRATFDSTELTVRILKPSDPIPTAETYSEGVLSEEPRKSQVHTYGSSKIGGVRQSKRIRFNKVQGRLRRITINPTMSIKDLKLKIQDELGIVVICQRLFYRGIEIEDNTTTIKTLGIMSNDLVDLREESEDVDLLSTDADDEDNTHKKTRKSRSRDEGRGFGGTLLGGFSSSGPPSSLPPSSLPLSSQNTLMDLNEVPIEGERQSQTFIQGTKLESSSATAVFSPNGDLNGTTNEGGEVISCPSCTFDNPPDVLACKICDTLFITSNA